MDSMNSNASDEGTSKPRPSWMVPAIAGGIVLVLVLGLLGIRYAINQSVISAGNKKEAQMNQVWTDGQNYLSDCLVKIHNVANVALTNSTNFDKIMSDAVEGRYAPKEGEPTNVKIDGGKLISAVVEAYPNLQGVTDLFGKVDDTIINCRTDFRDKQSAIKSRLAEFDSWRTGSWTVRHFGGGGFPNKSLHAFDQDGQPISGQKAYEVMNRTISSDSASAAYRTGKLGNDDPFATPTTGG